jgi:replication factor A1
LSAVRAIVEDILAKRPDLTEEQVQALVEEKKKEGRGLLSDEGAARLVAEELLVQTRGTSSELGRMQVKDLVSGLNDVTISGRILLSWPPQGFQRRDGSAGRVMRLIIVDKTGRARCALWDRHADVASSAGNLQGKIIRIGHAYTRQGLRGDTEIHAGARSNIEIDPHGMPIEDFPEFKELFTPLANLSADVNQVNAVGFVQTEPRYYSFTKEDRAGSVLRTIMADESGSIPVVFWNERAEELKEVKKGNILQIMNARTRLDNNGRLEVHVEARSQAIVLASPPEFLKMPVQRSYSIADLAAHLGSVDMVVSVLARGQPRDVKRTTGESVKVASLLVADGTGIATLSLWDDKAGLVDQAAEGDVVELHGVSVREQMGEIRLSLGRSGELQKIQAIHEVWNTVTKLNALQEAKGLLIVEGAVSDEPVVRQVVTERGESVNVASFILRDDVGSARVTLWREQAMAATKFKVGTRLKLVGVRVRPGLTGQLELSTIPVTKIEKIDQVSSERPAWEDIRQVIVLEPGLTTWVKGVILEIFEQPEVGALCETCGALLTVTGGELYCDSCKSPKVSHMALNARLRIDDGTGAIVVVIPNLDITELASIDIKQLQQRMLKEGKASLALGTDELSSLIEEEVEVYGTAEPSNAEGKLDFRAKKILLVSKI